MVPNLNDQGSGRRGSRRSLALGLAAAGAAANVPSTTYADKAGGYAITIPKNWELVPRTVAGVKALAAKLKKKKSTADLGNYYMTLIATPAAAAASSRSTASRRSTGPPA